MTYKLLIHREIFAHFLIHYEALPHIYDFATAALLNFQEKLIFFFISVYSVQEPQGFKAKSNPIRRSLRRFNTLRGARSPSAGGGSGTVLSVDGGRNILEAPSIV
jgi:hypothetical protein